MVRFCLIYYVTVTSQDAENRTADAQRENRTAHDHCIDAWANINQNADDNGCVKRKILKKFVSVHVLVCLANT